MLCIDEADHCWLYNLRQKNLGSGDALVSVADTVTLLFWLAFVSL